MKIQEIIGKRIAQSRKQAGLTLRGLADKSRGKLTTSRIANWEAGTRTPGPNEALLLGELLNVAPSYLLGLTSEENGALPNIENTNGVPLLSYTQALAPEKNIEMLKKNPGQLRYAQLGGVDNNVQNNWFALEIKDDSMSPKICKGDVAIINPNQTLQPGCFVVAKIKNQSEVIVRQYKQLSSASEFEAFELAPLNPHWANITADRAGYVEVIGVVQQITHVCTQ